MYKGPDMDYYIPLYHSEPIILEHISEMLSIIRWVDVPEKAKQLLLRRNSTIPESVAVSDKPEDVISTELKVLAFIFEKPYYVHQWANENVRHGLSTAFSIPVESPRKLINDEYLESFLKIALPLSHNDELQRILSYYYEIEFRTSSIEVKIITMVSLLEYIVSTHQFEKENVISEKWIKQITDSFIEEVVKTGYVNNSKEAKSSGKYNLLSSSLGNINNQSTKNKIHKLCEICGLNVSMKILNKIYETRNSWIHGGTNNNLDSMMIARSSLQIILEMIIVYELTGRDERYQQFMNSFTDKNGIVLWEHFFDCDSSV